MHELSISEAVLGTALRHAGDHRVTAVQLRIGGLRQVVPDSLSFYWAFVSQGTACEGARLEIEHVPVRLRCAPCEYEWQVEIAAFRCPHCGGSEVTVASGDELEVESIDVEEAAECIAPR